MASSNVTLVSVTDKQLNQEQRELDQYGRDAAERTVELKPFDAECVNKEVLIGRWQTYDDALSYLIGRGVAEVARARKAAEILRKARVHEQKGKVYSEMLKLNPTLVTDPEFVTKMIAALGVTVTK